MRLAELKHEAERPSPAEHRHLAALKRKSDPGFQRRPADKTPG
jgi:hypothetical protein